MNDLYRRSRYFWLIALVLVVVRSGADAQESWTNYTNTDAVYAVVEDGAYLWAGTGGGLVRFDIVTGASTVMTTADGLSGNRITQLLIDRSGTLWARGELGISSYSAGKWKRHVFTLSSGATERQVTAMALDSSGRVVVAIGDFALTDAIARYDGGVWRLIEAGDRLPKRIAIDRLMADRRGSVWGTGLDLRSGGDATIALRIAEDSLQVFHQEDGLPTGAIYAVAVDSSDAIWLAGSSGLTEFDGTKWLGVAPFTDPHGLLTDPMTLAVDAASSIWIGGPQGVDRFDRSVWRHFTVADGLPSTAIYEVLIDGAAIWAGGRTAVAQYIDGRWTAYDTASGLPSGSTITVLGRGRNGILAATTSGVLRFDGERWREYNRTNTLHDNVVLDVTFDSSGDIWAALGIRGGVDRYDGTTWRHFSAADGLLGDTVCAIARGRGDEVWVSGTGGISRYHEGAWQTYLPEPSLGSVRFTSILVDSSGDVWTTGSNDVVYRFDGHAWTRFTGPADGKSFGIGVGPGCVDPSGNVWFVSAVPPVAADGVTFEGLYRFDGASWTTYHLESGWSGLQQINPPRAITADRSGALWIAFDALVENGKMYTGGISRFDGTAWRHYRSRFEIPRMPSDPDKALSIAIDSAGTIWFGTSGSGLVRYDGVQWKQYTEESGLASEEIRSIAVDGNGLAIATFGGLSRMTGLGASADAPRSGPVSHGELAVLPNPVVTGEQAVIAFAVPRSSTARLIVRDLLGRAVAMIFDGPVETGKRVLYPFDVAGLPSGVYYLELESDGAVRSERFLLAR